MNSCFLVLAALIVVNTSIAMENDKSLFSRYPLELGDHGLLIHNNSLTTAEGLPIQYNEYDKAFFVIRRTNEGRDTQHVDLTIQEVSAACEDAMRRLYPSGHTPTTSTTFTGSTSSDNAPRAAIGRSTYVPRAATGRSTYAPRRAAKLATYSPAITATAAITGVLAEEIAKRKFETSEKKAFFVGVGATSVASLIGQSLQQDEHTPGRVFTQVAIDAAFYTAVHHVNNYFWPTAKKKTAQEAAKASLRNPRE